MSREARIDGPSALELACSEMMFEAQDLTDQLRAKKLRELKVLEVPSTIFDELISVAAHVAGVPSAALTFIDDRKAIISNCFSNDPNALPSEMDRRHSICNISIVNPDVPHVVVDSATDPRFADIPAVKNGVVRFYCGVTIMTDGIPIGALCVYDKKPRTIDDEQVKALEAIARAITRVIYLKAHQS